MFGAPAARNFPPICSFAWLRRVILAPFASVAPAARKFPPFCFGAPAARHFEAPAVRNLPPPFCHLRTAGAQFLCHFILARLKRAIFPPFFCAPAARSFPLILFFASAARDFPSGFLRIFARLQLAILPPFFLGGRLDLPGRPHGANRRYGLRRV